MIPTLAYLTVISLIAIILTGYDKYAAKERPRSRVPEATLLTVSALGGSLVMYLTMQLIRHKTQHPKFMIGLPLILFLQILVLLGVRYLLMLYDPAA